MKINFLSFLQFSQFWTAWAVFYNFQIFFLIFGTSGSKCIGFHPWTKTWQHQVTKGVSLIHTCTYVCIN